MSNAKQKREFIRWLLNLEVKSYKNERGRYVVTSESDPDEKYFVDLLEYKGNGNCDCPEFRNRIGPYLAGHKFLLPAEVATFVPVCKHIIAAMLFNSAVLTQMQIEHEKPIKH